jgi:hypothetical protein
MAKKIKAIKSYLDVDYLIENARRHNVKLIARIVCFRDDYLALTKGCSILDERGSVWRDKKGLAWTNPYQQDVRNYLVAIAKELVQRGIRSLAFDYLRFPTDGDLGRIRLTHVQGARAEPILEFLKTVKEEVGQDAEIGVCVFGYAVWRDLKTEGQVISRMGDYIDVLYPMLYPSHFPSEFKKGESDGWRNYWIYFDSVKMAMRKLPPWVRVVPFVQGFTLHADTFEAGYVFSQIDGALTADAQGYVIWNARGDYAVSWLALSWARSSILRQYVQIDLNNRMREAGRRYQDIILEPLLFQETDQEKNPTTDPMRTPIDTLPLRKTRTYSPDPARP